MRNSRLENAYFFTGLMKILAGLLFVGMFLYSAITDTPILRQESNAEAQSSASMTQVEWAKLEYAQSCRELSAEVNDCAEYEAVYTPEELTMDLTTVRIID